MFNNVKIISRMFESWSLLMENKKTVGAVQTEANEKAIVTRKF